MNLTGFRMDNLACQLKGWNLYIALYMLRLPIAKKINEYNSPNLCL